MRHFLFLFSGFLTFYAAYAQHALGVPEIINYPKQLYNAGTQSWDMKQDSNGILYFANNDGLLTFDGFYWRTYSTPPAKTHIRSIEIGTDNKIYIGSQDDIGYFTPAANGELVYTSLKSLLPLEHRSMSEIWDVVSFNGDIFFRSDVKIFQFSKGRFTIHKASSQWRFLGVSNNVLLAQDRSEGLFIYSSGRWEPIAGAAAFPTHFYASGFLPYGKDSSLLISTRSGFYFLHGKKITPFTSPDLSTITDKLIFGACPVGKDKFAIATRLNGCFIIDRKGRILNHYSIREGLQTSNVYSVFADKNSNLWLCLDNGIDFIAYNNAIKHIYPETQNNGSGYTSYIYNNKLYLGSSNGLFSNPVKNNGDLSDELSQFSAVPGTGGQVWSLTAINGRLLMGHHDGAFEIENDGARPLSNWSGFWAFKPLSNIPPSPVIIGGNYRGVSFFRYNGQRFVNADSNLLFESARFLAVVNDEKTVWVAHPYKGLYRLRWDENNAMSIRTYTTANTPQLTINRNFIFKIRNNIILTSDKGIFEYNPKRDSFELSSFLNPLFKTKPVSYLKEDSAGNIWFVNRRMAGVLDMSSGVPEVINIPELNNQIVNGFENINPINPQNVIIGGEKGFYHINFEAYKKNSRRRIEVHLSRVQSSGRKDSLLFGGYFGRITDTVQREEVIPRVSYENNSFHFEYSSTNYGEQAGIEFSYFLKGFDKQWSEWQRKNEKDYTNLPAGTYSFQVKCRNGAGLESMVSQFTFKVLPPWYQTWWAYSIYLLIISTLLYIGQKQQKRKFLKQQKEKLKLQQQRHLEEQRELQYQHTLELEKNEKEIIRLKNENLQTQLETKNAELAGNAMSLVQRSELLSRIKEQLLALKNNSETGKESKELKKMISIINKELELNNDWDQFAVHFDEVHANFLTQLKKKYPALTAGELKLCAYLRLNLTSKEIAQLMNISLRGVETSRYRVRKKLGLSSEDKLFNLLFSVESGSEEAP